MREGEVEASGKGSMFRFPGLSLDLEVGRADSRIQAIGGGADGYGREPVVGQG